MFCGAFGETSLSNSLSQVPQVRMGSTLFGGLRVLQVPLLNFLLKTERDLTSDPLHWLDEEIQSRLPTDVLLLTADDDGFYGCYSLIHDVRRSFTLSLGYVHFGRIGDVPVALIKCEKGPLETLKTVENAAGILNPKLVISTGTCTSFESAKAKLGDVLISSKLGTCDDKKVRANGTVEYRGTKANVSRNMGKLILHAADGWKPPLQDPNSAKIKVHRDAVILSGSETVDNNERRFELQNYFQDAVGLEQEGAGLYAAAYDLGIEWAVVKGVSGFADGSETATQGWKPFAAAMAASVVYNICKHSVVFEDWPRYKEIQGGSKKGGSEKGKI